MQGPSQLFPATCEMSFNPSYPREEGRSWGSGGRLDPSLEMTAPEKDTGNQPEANLCSLPGPGLAVEDSMELCCHLEGNRSTAAMVRPVPQV